MIKEERKNGNVLANMIHKINLDKNFAVLLLDQEEGSLDLYGIQEQFTNFDPVMKVDIDINLSAQVNVQRYFEIKKKSQQKEHRTKEAADQAIKVAENNAMKDLEHHRN